MLTGFRAGPRIRRLVALVALALLAGAGRAGAAETFKPLVQGEPAPDFTLPDTAGKRVSLSDFRGRVILLSFVSCYTDTCMVPVNALEAVFAKLGPARVAAPTVCAEIPDALRQNGYEGLRRRCSAGQTILIDLAQEASARYRVSEFPTSVLIGPDFTVRELIQGVAALRDPNLPARIEALAGQVAPAPPRP